MNFWDKIVASFVSGLKLPDTITDEDRIKKLESELDAIKSNATSPKQVATDNREPYISVLQISVANDNPRLGSFELDWNEYFIKQLAAAGYKGASEEAIVDQWFQDVCRHIVLESYEQEMSSIAQSDNIRYINRNRTGNGKTEIS